MSIKRSWLLLPILVLLMQGLPSCYIFKGKNKCDSCPGLVKTKKTKKATKGSI